MSPTTLFILAAIAVLVLTLAAVGVHLIARLRAQEATGSDPASPASDDNLSEMREIGQRIESLVSQQQEQGETQRQRLAQQIDTVQQTVGEQRVLVDGLRSEMRHEAKRRDHELDDIRTQIASIQQAMPALTGGTTLALPEPEHAPVPSDVATEDTDSSAEDTWMDVTPDAPQEEPATTVDPFAFDSFEATDAETPEAHSPETDPPEADTPLSEITSPMVDLELLELATDSAEDSPAEDAWAITPDWSEAAPTETDVAETVHAEAIAHTPEPPAESSDTVEADDLDIFADVSTFEIVSAPTLDAPQADETWTAEPDASSMESASSDPTDPVAFTSPIEPDVHATSAPQEESLFEELKIEEMSFQEMSFGEPETDAFDPDEAALEIDAIEAALTDLLPGAPPSDAVDSPVVDSPVEEPEASIFMDTLVSNELAMPEPAPVQAAEPAPEAPPEAHSDPSEDDIFAPTSFLDADDAIPTADPLAFEEMFVPTPVDAEPSGDDVFASWSPSSFEPAQPANTDAATPTFSEAPPEAPSPSSNEPQIGTNPQAPVDLSSFEDWGLDPEPVAAPLEPQTTAWAPPGSPNAATNAWAPAPPPAPTPAPTPQASATEAPTAPESHGTAWVVRNETRQPSAPPASDNAPEPEAAAMPERPLAYDENPAGDEAVTYDATGGSEAPVMAATPMTEEPSSAMATEAVEAPPSAPMSDASLASIPVAEATTAPEPTPEPAPEPQPLAEGVERLSVLPSIDDDLERALHIAGVTTLDEMARWGRTEARRIATEVGVSEDTVLNHWVFEAQTALFERFTQQVGS